MRKIKPKIRKRKKWRKPGTNYSKTSRLSRDAARKKLEKLVRREIQRMKIEGLEDLEEKGEKKEMEFLILEERLVPEINQEEENMKKNKEGAIVTLENPPEMIIKKGGPHGEDIVFPLKYIDGVPVYIKEVELPTDELFGWERKKEDKPCLMAENKKRLNTLKGFFLTIWKLLRMIPI